MLICVVYIQQQYIACVDMCSVYTATINKLENVFKSLGDSATLGVVLTPLNYNIQQTKKLEKEQKWVEQLTGCGPHGYSLVSFLFQQVNIL